MLIREAYETVHVTVNGKDCSAAIAPPYVFHLEKAAGAGKNSIEIEVISTLYRSQRELFSMFVQIEPLGIVSPVEIYAKK